MRRPTAKRSRFGFIRDVVSELRKVAWPSRRDVAYLGTIVVIISLVVAIFLGAIDFGFYRMAGELFPLPAVAYSGTVKVDGVDAVDGTQVIAVLTKEGMDSLPFDPVAVSDGRYEGLVVSPNVGGYSGGDVYFFVDGMFARNVAFSPSASGLTDVVNLSAPSVAVTYSGTVTVGEGDAAGGTEVTAVLTKEGMDDMEFGPVEVSEDGQYEGLLVYPGSRGLALEYIGGEVSFYVDGMPAAETAVFNPLETGLTDVVDLSAPSVSVTYSGTVTVDGVDAAIGTEIYAVVGTYTSEVVTVTTEGLYEGLVISPGDRPFLGEAVSFYVDGMPAATEPEVIIFDPRTTGPTDVVNLSVL